MNHHSTKLNLFIIRIEAKVLFATKKWIAGYLGPFAAFLTLTMAYVAVELV